MVTPPLRIIFMGTAPLAAESLKALLEVQFWTLIAAVTQPDKPKGRDLKLHPSAVKEVALAHQIPVLQPAKARDPLFIEELRKLNPDLIVVAAYGQILPQAILDLPKHGCINVHASLLPRWRGAAPIQWAILEGDPDTGVTIMKMDAGLDTGDMLTKVVTPISGDDNAQTLHDRLATLGAGLLVETIPNYVAGQIAAEKQPAAGVTYARKITKEDGRLEWTQSAHALWNRLRAFTPWPGAYTFFGDAPHRKMLKIWEARICEITASTPGEVLGADKDGIMVACGTQSLNITFLQREGGKRMTARDFLAGNPIVPGQIMG